MNKHTKAGVRFFLTYRQQYPPQQIKLCVLICPLYKFILDLIHKEQLKYGKGVVRIDVGRGATGVVILNL